MIRLQEIQEALLGVVGWTQNYDPQNQIDNALTESESGLTFQGAHPLVTLENIANIMPDSYLYVYPDWVATRYYHKGSKVKYQNNKHNVLESFQNHPPPSVEDLSSMKLVPGDKKIGGC